MADESLARRLIASWHYRVRLPSMRIVHFWRNRSLFVSSNTVDFIVRIREMPDGQGVADVHLFNAEIMRASS